MSQSQPKSQNNFVHISRKWSKSVLLLAVPKEKSWTKWAVKTELFHHASSSQALHHIF